jgi:hypothetical protein
MPATPQQQTTQQLLQTTAPTTAGDALTAASDQQQIGLAGPELAQTEAYNNALGGFSTQQYGVTQAQNALSQQGNAQQYQQGIAQQGFEQQNYGLQQQAFGLQSQQNQLAHTTALQNQSTSGAASGTLNTVGQGRDTSNINSNFALQQALLGNSQQQSQISQQAEQSGFGYSQEQIGNAGKNLGLIAQANGISQSQALSMLNYGNQQSATGAQQDVLSLLSQYGQTGEGDVSTVGAALSQQGFAGGINALAKPG